MFRQGHFKREPRILQTDTSRVVATLVLSLLLCTVRAGQAEEQLVSHFEGRVVVEWLDGDSFTPKMRLLEDLVFYQSAGHAWRVPAGTVIDGRAMPALFVKLMGYPFDSTFRRSAVAYDHAAKSKQQGWQEAQRMFHDAALVEGVLPIEAKVMYLLLYSKASRWAVRDTRDCHGRCHRRDEELEWSPEIGDDRVISLIGWIRSEAPSLAEIESMVDKFIVQKGPHVVGRIADVKQRRDE